MFNVKFFSFRKNVFHIRFNELGVNNVSNFKASDVYNVYANMNYNIEANDIAILESEEDLFAEMEHVKLASNFNNEVPMRVKAMGFGDYDKDGKCKLILEGYTSEVTLQYISVDVLHSTNQLREIETFTHPFDECQKVWDRAYRNSHICVGDGRRGIATGDSGGPLLAQSIDGEYYQVGVASYGGKQNTLSENNPGKFIYVVIVFKFNFLGMFAKINKYCPWIEKVTNGTVMCHKIEFMTSFLVDDDTPNVTSIVTAAGSPSSTPPSSLPSMTTSITPSPSSSATSYSILLAMILSTIIYVLCASQ